MRRWVIGLLVFLFLALSVFSIILGRQVKKIAEMHHSFLKKPTARTAQAHNDKIYRVNPNRLQ